MRFFILTLIGLITYSIIAIPGWFFLVPRDTEIKDTPAEKKTAVEGLFDPGKEPPPK